MATHDYVIDNSTGANVRADINNVLQAILTNNSNSSAPSTTAAYMLWADTTTGTLKIRNAANNAWVELLQLDGTLTLEDGSASTPGLAFRDDLNTGIYSSAADTFNIATAGVERMELSGGSTIFNEDGADVDFRIEGDTEANLFFVDAGNDRIGIGTSSPVGRLHVHNSGTGSGDHAYAYFTTGDTGATASDGLTIGVAATQIASINYREAGTLSFGTSSTERMRIDSSGRVMIGTTTEGNGDGDDLTIATSGRTGMTIRSADDDYGNIFFSDATSGASEYVGAVQYYHADNSMRFKTNSNDRLIIDSSGNVGIGTTSPDLPLHVSGTSNADEKKLFRITNAGGSAGTTAVMEFECGADEIATISANNAGGDIGNLMFATARSQNAYPTEAMRIDSSGNVGIGTTSPIGKLQVAGGGIVLSDGWNTQWGANADRAYIQGTSGGSGHLQLGTNNTERMRIDSAGNVLIGRTSTIDTSEVLGIKGPSGDHCTFGLTTNGTTNQGIIAFNDDDANFRGKIAYVHNGDSMQFSTAGSERLRIDSSGNLLIGTTSTSNSSPGTKTEAGGQLLVNIRDSTSQNIFLNKVGVNGTFITFAKDSSTKGSITTDGTNTAYNTSSDYRLKENETLISDGITRLKTLKPYRFNWKSDKNKIQDGFFAHEVTAVPEAITGIKDEIATEDNDELDYKKGEPIYQSLDYAKLTPLLTAALQEAIAKIETLETKVAALEAA